MPNQIKIEYIDPKRLEPYDRNPRTISEKAMGGLKASIKEYGIVDPFVVNKRNGLRIVGGHQRCKAAIEMGIKKVPIVYVDLDSEAEKALNVTLNNPHISGEWSVELGDILGEIKGSFPDLYTDLNFEPLEGDVSDVELEPIIGETDPDAVPLTPKEPIIKTGDLVTLGRHKILCGDSTRKEDVERLMAEEKIDCAIVDPPYGVSYADKNAFLNSIDKGNYNQKKIEQDHGSTKETADFWALLFKNISDNLNNYSSYYIFGPQGGDLALIMMMMNENDLPLRHTIIWAKNNHVLGRCDYNYKHEPILFGWKDRHKFYGNGEFKTSVWEVNKPLKNDLHPTMKPVELIVNAILNSTERDMVVVDLCLGAGSVLIACETTSRVCRGIEIDPGYVQVCVQRWIDFTGRPEDVTIERDGKYIPWGKLNG